MDPAPPPPAPVPSDADSSSAPPPPWGRYRLGAGTRALVAATAAVPGWPLIKQLAFPIRRLARLFMGESVDHTLWGHHLRFHPHGNISERRMLFMPTKWDRAERELLARHLTDGAVFLDVGGNFGGYTWWVLSQLGGECSVVVLEPDPELNARLHFNLATNGRSNVRVLPYAAGPEDGSAVLHIDAQNRGENSLLGEGVVGGEEVEVPLRTLSSVLAETGHTRVDALKIDIEGLEPPVLRAFFETAEPDLWPTLLLCERKDTPEHDDLEAYIRSKGYRLELRTRLNMVLRRQRSG